MKNSCLIFTLFFIMISCGNSVIDKPDNLIDDDIMIDIFYDLAIIDAGRNTSYQNGISTFEANDFIYKKYQIDSLTFAKSNKYYASDVAKYKRMFKIVKDKLNDKKTEIENLNKRNKTTTP